MNELRLAIIGVGNMGSLHVIMMSEDKVKRCRLTAVCDIKQSRLDWAKEFWNVQADVKHDYDLEYYLDYKDLLKSENVDAILISTPHYLHPVIGIEGFLAGKHVLSEKPIGVYTKKVEEFMAVAKKAREEKGLAFGVMLNQRPEPNYQKMREIVQSGELGQMKRVNWIITNWYRTQDYYNSGGWRATYAGEGGGVLTNQCPHQLDLWQWIYGMPKRIRAFTYNGKYHDIEVEDDVTAYAEYEDGSTGVFVTTTGEFPGTNRLEISGSKGKLLYENGKLLYTKLSMDEREFCYISTEENEDTLKLEQTTEEIQLGYGKGHRAIVQDFTNHIIDGTPLLAPGEDGIKSLSIANAMVLSSWTDKWVDLPNDGEEYWALLQERIKTSKVKDNVTERVINMGGTFNTGKK